MPEQFAERVRAAEMEARMKYPSVMKGGPVHERIALILSRMMKGSASVRGIFYLHEDNNVTCAVCGARFEDSIAYTSHHYLHEDQVRTVMKYGHLSGVGHADLWAHTNEWNGVFAPPRRTA